MGIGDGGICCGIFAVGVVLRILGSVCPGRVEDVAVWDGGCPPLDLERDV